MVYRILAADDDPIVREAYEVALADIAGHEVTFAESGEEAMMYVGQEFDVLVLDNEMLPGPKGPEVARAFRDNEYNGPIFLCTGDAIERLDLEGIDVTYMRKPISPTALIDEIEKALGSE